MLVFGPISAILTGVSVKLGVFQTLELSKFDFKVWLDGFGIFWALDKTSEF